MASEEPNSSPGEQVAAGLVKLSMVLRHQAWQDSGQRGLTPTQSQVLAMLATLGPGVTVSAVAQHLSVTKGSASVAVSTLEKKDLIRKEADPADGRVQHLKLTRAGRREAQRATQWPEVLVQAIDTLPDRDRGGFLRGLIGVIGNLQAQGSVPTSRMCVECRFFRPNQHLGSQRPHHCNFIDAAIADTDLRVDCAEMEPAEPEVRTQLMEALFSGAALTPPPTTPDRNDSHP